MKLQVSAHTHTHAHTPLPPCAPPLVSLWGVGRRLWSSSCDYDSSSPVRWQLIRTKKPAVLLSALAAEEQLAVLV